MAKDPAVLFYTSDFLTGTALMTNEQVGKYIKLLCLQHQHGHLSEQQMLFICGTYDKDIFSKFLKDDNGFYFQERMEEEFLRRQKFCESRKHNRNAKNDGICKTYDNHMSQHMETENETDTITDTGTKNETEKKSKSKIIFQKPTKTEIIDYINEKQLKVDSESFYDHYESNGWKVGKVPMKDWKATLRNWDRKTKEVKKPFKNEFLDILQKEKSQGATL